MKLKVLNIAPYEGLWRSERYCIIAKLLSIYNVDGCRGVWLWLERDAN